MGVGVHGWAWTGVGVGVYADVVVGWTWACRGRGRGLELLRYGNSCDKMFRCDVIQKKIAMRFCDAMRYVI